ncbi:MerR family transcriptional regulator [Clostridium uliginosum]|uniref:DNA-binding transcriptional regulator, MerR family n=1 Tax=Clostridium uliginosum TaxID=119641 RepID=A0A1I1SGX9_9CLOT|nr:MerR family transcriptional regulator [Clostridium uliginosum]SFD45739.1 DNA-binding transcriptional regulator, MerR family [Clostridium uliginosum]
MELQTISQVSKIFKISTRTLRYYEEIGLIESLKKEGYAYRTYDDEAIKRLKQIMILRKLRLSLKEIEQILKNNEISYAIEALNDKLEEVNYDIKALDDVKNAILMFINKLNDINKKNMLEKVLDDETLLHTISAIADINKSFNVKKIEMEDLRMANNVLDTLKNLRIVCLPPMNVASIRAYGKEPEDMAMRMLIEFVEESELLKYKADAKVYGFNNHGEPDSEGKYGYEYWITIPKDFEVPVSLEKKSFTGGMYGAHCIKFGNFNEWQQLERWANNNEEYVLDYNREPRGMCGYLEEHMNV